VTVSLLAVLGTGVVDPATPVVQADDAGLTRGDGCFEGCHVRTDADGRARVDKVDAHLSRMARSAASLGIVFDRAQWHAFVDETLHGWHQPGEAAMKLVLTRGPAGTDAPVGFLTISPLPPDYPRQRRDGLRVITLPRATVADGYDEASWLLGGVKTLSYAVNMAAQREAERRGADDAIFVSADGWVLEAPTSTVVWTEGRTLATTPTGGSGILAGTTQALLFERAASAGWRAEIRSARVDDLHTAQVVWLVSTVRGPVDVVELDGKQRDRLPEIDAQIRRLAGF
jgi:4-amino-4-deoxychorismate lyase